MASGTSWCSGSASAALSSGTCRCARQRPRGSRRCRHSPAATAPEMPSLSYDNNMKTWGPELCARRPDITMEMVDTFLTNMYRKRADFVYTATRDFVRGCKTPILVLPDDGTGASICRRHGNRASRAERASKPLPVEEDTPDTIPLAVRHIRTFLRARIGRWREREPWRLPPSSAGLISAPGIHGGPAHP